MRYGVFFEDVLGFWFAPAYSMKVDAALKASGGKLSDKTKIAEMLAAESKEFGEKNSESGFTTSATRFSS